MHEIVTLIAKYLVVVPPLIFLYILWRLKASERKQFIVEAAIAAIMAVVTMKLASSLYHDPRPFVRDGVHPYFPHANDNGFPSDHATLSALIAWLVLSRNRVWGGVLLVIALLIGSARVIAGIHHGVDILGGFVIAGVSVAVALGMTRFAIRKPKEKAPE